ncbi:MAG: hypothetical protein EON58_04005 [Alphaproteobacteria bacterium]|nr:MAG: hypothetical protein EON58_04005 [Alphaproteobacteria bacterium]
MNGYMLACGDYGIGKSHGFQEIPEDFHDWAAYRTHFDGTASGWCGMITEAAGSDELAFDRFFELLDEYENRQPKVFARVGNSGIALVTYTDDPGFFAIPEGEGPASLRGRFFPTLKRFDADAGSLEIVDPGVFARINSAEDAD